MARRREPVLRTLDDRMMVAGIVSWDSVMFVGLMGIVALSLDLLMDFWTLAFGRHGFLVQGGFLAAVFFALLQQDRLQDRTLIASWLRFHLERRADVLYSAMARDGWRRSAADRLLGDRTCV